MSKFSIETRRALAEHAISTAASLLSEGKVSEASLEVQKAAFWLEELQQCMATLDVSP